MDDSGDLLQLAALLERAYRLALDMQDDLASMASGSRQAAVELVDMLDDARVLLLQASLPPQVLPPQAVDPLSHNRSTIDR